MTWFYHDGTDRYDFQCRRDLVVQRHQAALARAVASGRTLHCGCRTDGPRLIPLRVTGGKYTLRRYRLTDAHAPGCPMPELEAMGFTSPVVYSDRILVFTLPSRSPENSTPQVYRHHWSDAGRYEDLVHLLQSEFTRAVLEVFAACNRGKNHRDVSLINPPSDDISRCFAKRLHEPILNRGSKSLAQALAEKDLILFWGLSSKPLVEAFRSEVADDAQFEFGVPSCWRLGESTAAPAVLRVPIGVARAARGKVMARGHLVGPPYFFAAVARRSSDHNEVVFFYRVPVVVTAGSIFMIESEVERRGLAAITGAGAACVKLHVQADLAILGRSLWSFSLGAGGRLPCRPDVIAFRDGTVRVIFITDFEDTDYHTELAGNILKLREMFGADGPKVCSVPYSAIISGSWEKLVW